MNIWILLIVMGVAAGKIPPQEKVPVLCYHNIYEGGNHTNDLMHISSKQFNDQLKALSDSGYHTILPDELIACLTGNTRLPAKAFMITFDDSHSEHFSIADSLLRHYGFRGVFFVMTVTIGKPGYLSGEQIRMLADQGHVIGAHTWDHPHLYATGSMDWKKQLSRPKLTLERITGKPVCYFAYPFGEWNDSIINQLKSNGYRAAFQLNGRRGDALYTIKRMMTNGRWSGARLQQEMAVFNRKTR